jgi:Contractile injection system tube protein
MAERGTLEKLVIKAYDKADYSGRPISEFQAYVNPSELTLAYEMEYDSAQGAGTTNSCMQFKKVKPGDLSITLLVDGTGANGRPLDVQQAIEQFQTVTGYNGAIHRPNYLKVAWGTLQVKRCILKSASIAYKMFKANGVPLRATISATFTDNSDDQTRVAHAQDESSDLTVIRVVKAGDTLPGLCNEIYGDPLLYPEVAQVNRIDDFRNLTAGMKLIFLPLEK